jgi:Niemann-Pick C1 protein
MRCLWQPAAIVGLLTAGLVSAEPFTPIHEAGRCAIRGACGSAGFFTPKSPCPDNGLAEEPKDDVRKQLVDLCGPKWSSGPVCCDGEQVAILPCLCDLC